MGGRASRSKGKRAEYLVRDYFRKLGLLANRVPSSGASEGFKGDVKVLIEGRSHLVEVKSRKQSFSSIYKLLNERQTMTRRFVYQDVCVTLSYDFLELLVAEGIHEILLEPKKVLNKILNMQKLLKGCQFLVIKDNNKPLIFILYA